MHETSRTIKGELERAHCALAPATIEQTLRRVAESMDVGFSTAESWYYKGVNPTNRLPRLIQVVDEIEADQKFARIRKNRSVSDWKTRALRALDILPDEQVVAFAMKLDKAAAVHQAVGEYRADVLAAINGGTGTDQGEIARAQAREDVDAVLPDPTGGHETPERTRSGAGA